MLKVKKQSTAKRCEICHQTDMFDAGTKVCNRCDPYKNQLTAIEVIPVPVYTDEKLLKDAQVFASCFIGLLNGSLIMALILLFNIFDINGVKQGATLFCLFIFSEHAILTYGLINFKHLKAHKEIKGIVLGTILFLLFELLLLQVVKVKLTHFHLLFWTVCGLLNSLLVGLFYNNGQLVKLMKKVTLAMRVNNKKS